MSQKSTLIDQIQSAHVRLSAIIDALSVAQMTIPGVIGDWSIKDFIAHLTYWEHRAAFLLQSAIEGYREEEDIWRLGSVDGQNERNFEANRSRPLADILTDWRDILNTLVFLIERLPEEKLTSQMQFGLLADETLGSRIANETFRHVEEHWPDLETWLARLKH
jgi:hypothetical protein